MSKQTEALKLALDWYDSGNENPDDFANMIKQVIALAQQPAQGCDYCNHPQYAGIKCKNCGREQSAQQRTDYAVHLHHCNMGEWEGTCKYSDPDCPALAHAALKAKLKPAQQQEPIAWMKDCADFWEHYTYISEASQENYKAEAQMWVEKLRKSPPASKPWVGLSTVELDEIDAPIRERGHATVAEIYRAIEAKLREKNT